jgi:hypothetical protein
MNTLDLHCGGVTHEHDGYAITTMNDPTENKNANMLFILSIKYLETRFFVAMKWCHLISMYHKEKRRL